MNSFIDNDNFLSETTRLNEFNESDQIDFEFLLESFDDVNTSPFFNLSDQSSEFQSERLNLMNEPYFQETNDKHETSTNKRKFDDFQSNQSNDDSSSIKSNSTSKKTNKQAALRYRLKKTNEKDKLFEAKDYLEKQNEDIKREIGHVKKEIGQLKTLIVQMLMFKGIMNQKGKIING